MQVGATPLLSGTGIQAAGRSSADDRTRCRRHPHRSAARDSSRIRAGTTPGSLPASSAAVVTVASGQERTGIDLQVRPVPMVKSIGHRRGRHGIGDASGATRSPGIRRRRTNGGRRRHGHRRQRRIQLSRRAGRRLRHQGRSGAKTRHRLPPRQRRSRSARA